MSRIPTGRSYWPLYLFLAGMCGFMLLLGVCVQEDAFISFRYARNLADGQGLVFNPNERVEGYTNFLWTVILAGGMALGLDPVPLSRLLGLAASLALVLLVFAFCRAHDRPRRVTRGLLAAAVVAAFPGLATEGIQGLETAFFALLLTAGVLRVVRSRLVETTGEVAVPVGAATASLLLALAALTRPEGVGVFGLVTAAVVWWRRRRGLRPWSRTETVAVAVFLAIYLPYWIWRFQYYGYPLPNTFYAKTGGGLWHLWLGLQYVGRFLLANPVLCGLTVWAAARWWRESPLRSGPDGRPEPATPAWSRDSPLSLIAPVVIGGYLLYVIAVGGDFKRTFRFVIPVLPLWAVWLDAAVSRWDWPLAGPVRRLAAHSFGSADRSRRRRVIVVWCVLAAVALNGLAGVPSSLRWARQRSRDLVHRTACGQYLAENARPGAVLAIHSAGIIPYYSGLRTLDMWGINDLHIGHAPLTAAGRRHPVGHQKRDDAYVFAQLPDYYVDEQHYAQPSAADDLQSVLLADPALAAIAARYRPRAVLLQLADRHGPGQFWFNYLELQ